MPYTVRAFQPTPNPNALKCTLDRAITKSPRSYFNAAQAEAANDPLAQRLFAIPHITNLLINADWITISKTPESDWKPIRAEVERVLREAE
jgi:hypothetical protein